LQRPPNSRRRSVLNPEVIEHVIGIAESEAVRIERPHLAFREWLGRDDETAGREQQSAQCRPLEPLPGIARDQDDTGIDIPAGRAHARPRPVNDLRHLGRLADSSAE